MERLGGRYRGQRLTIAQPPKELADPLVGAHLRDVHRPVADLARQRRAQRLPERHAAIGMRAHKGERGVHLVGLQLHPLAAQPDQRLLERRQPLQLLLGELLVAERELPVIGDHGIQTHQAAGGLLRAAQPQAHVGPGRHALPPRRHLDAEPRFFQQRHALPQEVIGLATGERAPHRLRLMEAALDGLEEPGRLP